MRYKNIIASLITISSLGLASCQAEETADADLILTNGYIYTVDKEKSVAEAIAIKDGKILSVGNSSDILQFKGPNSKVENLEGKMVMPGLHDMHIHALDIVKPDMCDFDSNPMSLDEMVPFLQGCIAHYKPKDGTTFLALQWNPFEGNQTSDKYPTIRAALDAVSSTHPIILHGNDGHHGAASSLAFNSLDVPLNAVSLQTTYKSMKGLVAVDGNGEPTGGLNEQARDLFDGQIVSKKRGANTRSEDIMPRVAKKLAANGITSIQDAIVTKTVLDHYKWLEDSGDMSFRVRTAFLASLGDDIVDGKKLTSNQVVDKEISKIKALRAMVKASEYIRPEATKVFADGVLEGNPHGHPPTLPVTAVLDGYRQRMFEKDDSSGQLTVSSYVDLESDLCKGIRAAQDKYDQPDLVASFYSEHGYFPAQCMKSYGTLNHPEETIRAYVAKATEAGFHVHIHALADASVKLSADMFEDNKAMADKRGVTQSIAHLQIGKTEDVKRLGALGAYVVFTYIWATPEPEYEMTVIPFLDQVEGINDLYNPGHYYVKNAYPFKSVQSFGGKPVFGSDAPVGSRDPRVFQSMSIALTRSSGEIVLNAAERLNIHDAIASYTINSAEMMTHEDDLGSLEVGKTADMIILDQNIVELAEAGKAKDVAKTKVLTTIFDGRIVYQSNQ